MLRHAVFVLGCLLATPAPAKPAAPKPAAPEMSAADRSRAKALFEEAETHYRLQEYEEALSGYREAYRLSSEPALLFNIGQCYRNLGRYDEALKSYQGYLSEAPDTPLRPKVEEIIGGLRLAIAAKKAEPPPAAPGRAHRVFYAAALSSAVLAAGAGGLSLFQARRSRALAEDPAAATEEVLAALASARALGVGADALLGVALVSGGVGLALSRRSGGRVAVAVSPSGAALALTF